MHLFAKYSTGLLQSTEPAFSFNFITMQRASITKKGMLYVFTIGSLLAQEVQCASTLKTVCFPSQEDSIATITSKFIEIKLKWEGENSFEPPGFSEDTRKGTTTDVPIKISTENYWVKPCHRALCATCPKLLSYHTITKQPFQLTDKFTCSSTNLIYAIMSQMLQNIHRTNL